MVRTRMKTSSKAPTKSIRRLFGDHCGRLAPGPSVFHRFQSCLYTRDSHGRLHRISWESEWKAHKSLDGRRTGRPDRREGLSEIWPSLRDPLCDPLRDHRVFRSPRRSLVRRRSLLRCEYCGKRFHDAPSVAAHWPCADSRKLKVPGLGARIELVRKKALVRTTEIEKVRDILLDSLSEQAYQQCLKEFGPRPHFQDPKLGDADNFAHYRLYRFASFVDALRPGEIDWITPSFAGTLRVARQLGETYHAAVAEMRTIGLSQSAGEKLARFILDLTADHKSEKGIVKARLPFTHEEIAQVLGTSRETVTRVFAEFKKKNLVNVKGSTFTVTNRHGLKRLVQR